LFELSRYLRREKPDVVVSFAARINLLVLGASISCKKPRLIVSERNDPMKDTRTAGVRKLAELLYPRADAIVFQTEHARSCFSQRVQQKGCLIPNPVTAGLPASTRSTKRIVAVGKLMQQKNHAALIRAFGRIRHKYPQHTLHIYGDGPLRPELERLIEREGLSGRVFLEGWQTNVNERIADAALFVLPSDYEGLSNALMEAVAMGMPCISTDCAGARDLIDHEKSGLIVPVGGEEELAQAMDRLLSDEALAAAYGDAARERAQAFRTDKILSRWEAVIEG
ncbi:MAG: glycosyltransferase, partial [Eubacteriales bacterium]|nr:glycosyltransferase [Eubacteriales bacterium]